MICADFEYKYYEICIILQIRRIHGISIYPQTNINRHINYLTVINASVVRCSGYSDFLF